LVVVEGAASDLGRAAPLTAEELIVGSAPECGLSLTDPAVSRAHLGVRIEDHHFRVRDLGSRNGTVYEGSLLSAALVPPGATFKVGHTFLRIQPEPQPLEVPPSQARRFGELVAESLAMREVFAVLELAASSDVTVLLLGETGTGKELAARAIHEASARRKGPFVGVDCSALPETLLESELFGHVRGAFTGAAQSRAGAFLRAQGGTLFLDELGTTTLQLQARLLRVLEERKVRPVGSDAERSLDVRVVAASRDDLGALVSAGTFRSDLYFRLSVLKVELPPLRTRREDLGPIVVELLRRRGLEPGPIEGPNLDRLVTHDWPGNVRELRNVIDRAIALSPGAQSFSDLRIGLSGGTAKEDGLSVRTDLSFADAKEQVMRTFEFRYLRDIFERCGGNLSAASRESGLDRKHLRTLLRKHGLVQGPEE
jgi:DNA-binding NtrC family response regulator